jgi:WD40 repeat protein
MATGVTRDATAPSAARDRPDVFVSYAREDKDFVEDELTRALVAHGKDVWIDVEDIRAGASDWRASVWAGIESATVMVFVLTPDSLASRVCGEELAHAGELNKRIIPVLRRSVDGLPLPPALARPNWILARADDDFDESLALLVGAIELDEAWVEQHARLAQRTGEWARHDRDRSYLLRGSDLREAERWLDDQGGHREAPTADQTAYITASRRAAARRQRGLLAGVALALVGMTVLAVVALVQRKVAIDRQHTAQAQARAAQSTAALARDPEESVRDALEAVDIRPEDSEARFALRRAVSAAGWTSILRLGGSRGQGLREVEFSDDGRRVATAGADRKAAVWDTRTGRRVAVVAHRRDVNTVEFSPDGRQLLTASRDGTARTWDSSTGRPLRVFATKSPEAWAATYGEGGRRIMTVTRRSAQVWDAASGAQISQLENVGNFQGTIRMSLDGRRVITSGGRTGDAWLWDAGTGRRIATLRGDGRDPLAFSLFSADGRRVATLYDSGAVRVWDGDRRIARIGSLAGSFYDADLSRDGRRLLRVDADGVVEVWDVASQGRVARLPNGSTVSTAQFDRTGEYVVTGGDDGVARVWNVGSQRAVAVLRGHTAGIRRARFSPDGMGVVTVSDDRSARLWPAHPQAPADPRWQSADGAAFSPSSRAVLVVRAGKGAIWSTATGAVVGLQGGILPTDSPSWACARAVGCAPWSPDGRFVAGADAAGGAVIWDARSGRVARRFGKATGTVTGAAFSPDGSRLVVVDANHHTARIWNVATGQPQAEVPPRQAARAPLSSAQFVGGSTRVLTVDSDGRAQLSEPARSASVALAGSTRPVAVAAARDGREIAIGTDDGELRLYSGAGRMLRSRRATNGFVNSLAFDRTGTAIATGGQRGPATTWDAGTLTPSVLQTPEGAVTGTTFSRDSDFLLVTAGATATLWDRRLRRVVVELPRTPNVRAELSPDGSRIVVAGAMLLEVLRCDACAPLDELERRARSLLPAS